MKLFLRSTLWRVAAVLLAATATAQAAAQTPEADEDAVVQIQMQSTACYGRCPVEQVTLNSDGSAQFSGDRNSVREGFYRGHIAPEAFSKLVDALDEQNFFDLQPQVGEMMVTDVPDLIISATRKNSLLGKPYTVATRWFGKKNPLLKLRAAFAVASAGIIWQKDEAASKTGASGRVTRDLTDHEKETFADRKEIQALSLSYGLVKLIAMGDTKTVYSTHTDHAGNFQILVPPGKYLLSINDSNAAYPLRYWGDLPQWLADGKSIEIAEAQMMPITMQLSDYRKRAVAKAQAAPGQ